VSTATHEHHSQFLLKFAFVLLFSSRHAWKKVQSSRDVKRSGSNQEEERYRRVFCIFARIMPVESRIGHKSGSTFESEFKSPVSGLRSEAWFDQARFNNRVNLQFGVQNDFPPENPWPHHIVSLFKKIFASRVRPSIPPTINSHSFILNPWHSNTRAFLSSLALEGLFPFPRTRIIFCLSLLTLLYALLYRKMENFIMLYRKF
jgi:hypothetical protein